jgi:hypothetical protein
MGARAWLIGGLVAGAAALALILSGAPRVLAGTNAVPLESRFATTRGPATVCQSGETLPAHTAAIRLALESAVGPGVQLRVLAGRHAITRGSRGSGWTGGAVTVAVEPRSHTFSGVTVCFAIPRSRIHVAVLGEPARGAASARAVPGGALPGRMRVEYLRAGRASWFSLAASVATRMGFGRAFAGSWIAWLVLALMLALVAVVYRVSVRELDGRARAPRTRARVPRRIARVARRVPRAAWACALVALLNAVSWSLITPPFQVPDEPSHYAYVQQLAENGRLPSPSLSKLSPALAITLDDLHSSEISFNPARPSLETEAQQRLLERDEAAPFSRKGAGGAGEASSEPPLYYALQLIPYELGSGGSVLDRLALMRLASALLAAITALFGYLFVREALPGVRWAWTVGGLAIALFPLLGFISGGANPDAMLYAVCAALYYCLARAFRRGLSTRLALAIGALTAVGFATKLNFAGFAPAAILGLVLAGARAVRARGARSQPLGRASRPLALGLALALGPLAIYALANLISGRPLLGAVSGTLDGLHGSLWNEVSYVWQFYLPRLPAMPDYFPAIASTSRELWLDGLIGLYGWADTLLPGWVYDVALIPLAAIAALTIRELARRREALRGRLGELSTYVLSGAAVVAVVGLQSFASDVGQGFEPFWEPRYLLPMLPLWGVVVALTARGAGRRWGLRVGCLLIVLLLAHDLVSQLQVIARYYG